MLHTHPITPEFIGRLLALGRAAGAAIMQVYLSQDDYSLVHKADQSPLTAADLAAQRVIAAGLPQLLDVPIISEEAEPPAFSERQCWDCYWLVDPLDGTKEFIAGNGEFTVNIALVRNGQPVVGLVHVPVTDISYLGVLAAQQASSIGAWKYQPGAAPQALQVSNLGQRLADGLPLRVLLSHRHGTSATLGLLGHLGQVWPGGIVQCHAGSSLKCCMIAEGGADFYPRLAPTCEWDTAAAQAVLEAAGGQLVIASEEGVSLFKPLRYNTSEELLNPYFYALGDNSFDWPKLLQRQGENVL